jgi:LacI family transcriptional regulator
MERMLDEHSDWPKLDGAILAGVPPKMIEISQQPARHVVHCSGGGDPAVCPVVSVDDYAVGVRAAEHLLNCRIESFAFYGSVPDYQTSMKRLAGFRDTVQARGLECVECPVVAGSREERASHANRPRIIAWLRTQPRPLGVLALDDTFAHDLAEVCREGGIAVPDLVAIVGVNNDDLLCESAWPPLTSVDADFQRVGYTAARILDRLLQGEKLTPEQRHISLPPIGVVQRQSTNTLAIDDESVVDALRFIREHACDPCSVTDVLREVPVGRRWLERQFQKHLGRSPHDEILRVRIEAAQRLLRKSDLTMFEITAKCGFAELRSFYRAFSEIAQTSPAAYRRASLPGT